MITIKNNQFTDSNTGNTIIFRGINLGGDSKNPIGLPTFHPKSLDPSEPISFVGRPFPLEEARIHLDRLKFWGFNLIRFVIVWEAVQPNHKDQYDQEYSGKSS